MADATYESLEWINREIEDKESKLDLTMAERRMNPGDTALLFICNEQAIRLADLRALRQKLLDKLPDQSKAPPGWTPLHFSSASDFLDKYEPRRLELLPVVSIQTTGVSGEGPSAVKLWGTFDAECQVQLRKLPKGRPVNLVVREPTLAALGSEDQLRIELDRQLFLPLEYALSFADGFFEVNSAAHGNTEGIWTNRSAHADVALLLKDNGALLVAIEVKASSVICVPQGSDLPAMYSASDNDSNIVKCVTQLFNYLDGVPFGVLVTDQQLFCVRREGTVLLCSRSIPLAGHVDCPAKRGTEHPSASELPVATCAAAAPQEQFEAAGGRSTDSLTAVAALYSMAKMAQMWWARQATGGATQGNNCDDGGGTTGVGNFKGATAADAASKPAGRRPTFVESQYTREQLFPGHCFDPRVQGGFPPPLGSSSCVLGAVGGRAAAIKLVDLWQGRAVKEEMRREVRTYHLLQSLQGVYVPRLLSYGYCDGWLYFLATSLEGPALTEEEGWALGDEATCEAAFAALDAVHRCGVIHGDISLRNFVLAAQPAGVGGGAAGGAGDGGDGSQISTTGQQLHRLLQPQPRVMLLDFGNSQLVAEAVEWAEDPAALIQEERRKLEELLGWKPSSPLQFPLPPVDTDAGSGAAAAAASGGAGGDTGGRAQLPQPGMPDTDVAWPGGSVADSRPGPPAAHSSTGPCSAFPRLRPPSGPSGWRQQLRFSRPHMVHVPRSIVWKGVNGGRSTSRLSLLRRLI